MSQWDSLIASAGQKYNVDPQLIASIVKTESSGNPNAYNAEYGATGLGQQIPATAKALGIDPKDPAQSIEGVAKLLNENLNRYGSPEQAVLAYHGGTDQANWGPKTQDYLRKVSANYGAPIVAKQTAQPAGPDAFEEMFGPRPSAATATAAPAATNDPFEAMFGPRPTSPELRREPAMQPPATVDNMPQPVAPATTVPGQAWELIQMLGGQGIKNANAVGRGISDALDAPSEWLASGAEASGLTGLLGKAGINMPTTEQQKQLNIQGRAAYDAANPEPGVQGVASRIGGNLAGVMTPISAGEAALVQGGNALAKVANIAPKTAEAIGTFLRGQGGLASRMGYNAAQGAAGGALLSGGQENQNVGDSAALGAALGAAVPIVGGALKYPVNAVKSLVSPFTEAGRAGIAGNVIRQEAALGGGAPAAGAAEAALGAPVASQPSGALSSALTAPQAAGRAGANGRLATDLTEYVPGSTPTLGQAAQNPGILALENAAKSRAPNLFAERDMANYQARNAFLDQIRGTQQTLDDAIKARDAATAPLRDASLQGARPANTNPVLDEIDSILKGPEGQRDAVVSALTKVRNKLDLGENGAQTNVAQLYGLRKSIGDQLEKVAGKDNSEAQLASRELLQVRDALDDAMEKAAPGFAKYRETYAEMSKPISAQSYLQGLNLTDASSQRITLPSMKNALLKIDKLRKAPGANDAKAISDDQMQMLNNLHKDLQRESGTAAGKVKGSDTFQNLATNQLIDSMMPGALGIAAPVTPGAVGGALGFALGGPGGAALGALAGQNAAGLVGRSLNAQSPAIENQLIDFLLNPKGAEVLKQMRSSDPQGLGELLRRAGGAAPATVAPAAGKN